MYARGLRMTGQQALAGAAGGNERAQQFALRIAHLLIGQQKVEVGLIADPVGVQRQSIGREFIIGVDKRQPVAGGQFHAPVARRRHAGVGLVHIHDPAFVAARHIGRIVGGTIVDDDDLVRRMGLSQDRLNGTPQGGTIVVVRDDDRKCGQIRRQVRGERHGDVAVAVRLRAPASAPDS